jgi:hypothetical protein
MATNQSPPLPPPPPGDDAELVPVFMTTAVRVSDGSHHGVHHVTPAEAGWLVRMRYACHGEAPPRGWNLEV